MKKDPNPCRVIGVLDDGAASLTPTALAYIRQADRVIGASRTLALLADSFKPGSLQQDMSGKLSQVPGWIEEARAHDQSVVVLATGDPLCHGIATYLASKLCVDAIDILPNVSTLQLACARIGLSWQDARIVSVHGRDAGEWQRGAGPEHGLYALAQALRTQDRLMLFTGPANTPARIARLMLIEGMGEDFQMAVAENLLLPEEQIYPQLSIQEAAERNFARVNVVLLWRQKARPKPVLLGLPDGAYRQRQPKGDGSGGLITKQEVRAVSLARLQLHEDSIVWDIGAGSGSVGLEAARLCRGGHVYAIEKNAADTANIEQNRDAMGLSNYTLLHAKAPEGLADWADPDAVFIGGSGGELPELIRLVLGRLKPGGHLVMNFVTLQNLSTAIEALGSWQAAYAPQEGGVEGLKDASSDEDAFPGEHEKPTNHCPTHEIDWDVLQLQASRSKPILHMHRLAAENPVWLVCVAKSAGAGEEGGR